MAKDNECFDELTSAIGQLSKQLDNLNELAKKCENYHNEQIKAFDDVETAATEKHEDSMQILAEIIEKAENWDYGLKGWRTLETKADLIACIKKEVLDVE